MAHTLFISDLHLDPDVPTVCEHFFTFLQSDALQAEALYILGDFFEVWVGDDDLTPFHRDILDALRHVTQQGLPVYFMHGNRDFLIGKRFARKTGVTLIKDPTVISLYGQKILLMHGDSLCTLDTQHQKSRKTMHNRWYQRAVLCLPLAYRRHVGKKIRLNSRRRKETLTNQIMDVTPDAVIDAMQTHDVNCLIHGHTHRPAVHTLNVNGKLAKRIVLGSWHDGASIGCLSSDGAFKHLTKPLLHHVPCP